MNVAEYMHDTLVWIAQEKRYNKWENVFPHIIEIWSGKKRLMKSVVHSCSNCRERNVAKEWEFIKKNFQTVEIWNVGQKWNPERCLDDRKAKILCCLDFSE